MLASLADAPLDDPALAYEPKYDGIRAIAEIPGGKGRVRLWSRLGNEKTRQFPEVAAALEAWARTRRKPAVLDGEVVALDGAGSPSGFQQLQGRIHLTETPTGGASTAFIVFDVLRDGDKDLRGKPFRERRAELERLLGEHQTTVLRLSDVVYGDGRALYDRALKRGWEGLIAKRVDSVYQSGKRTPDWRKLKIIQEQEFVIGGWTEPRQTRSYFGALLLGVYEGRLTASGEGDGESAEASGRKRKPDATGLIYVGHVGTGFNERELERLMKQLRPLETRDCPFAAKPPTNERPHWVAPRLVAQIRFTEWTADGKLRHPVYLGLRDDKRTADVVREQKARFHEATMARVKPARSAAPTTEKKAAKKSANTAEDVAAIVEQLDAIERGPGDGVVTLAGGAKIAVTNLRKIFWPKLKRTKGDLFRYYVQVSPALLPALADRPLVMKRFPNGVAAPPFYQHRADAVPAYVRTAPVKVAEARTHIVGGDLATLLYTTQLAAISQDPWFSRVATPRYADHVALDLDPSDGVPFSQVLDVARWIHDALDSLGAAGFPKTSGSSGLHVYLPLPPETPYEAGLLLCQIVASLVVDQHSKQATLERSVRARGKRVYVDCLQNVLGKTLASAYSVRASDYAGVSAPLTWKEVEKGIRLEDFTIASMPARLEKTGDLWKGLRDSKGIDLGRLTETVQKAKRR